MKTETTTSDCDCGAQDRGEHRPHKRHCAIYGTRPTLPAPERLRMIAACLAALQLTQGTPGFATAPDELRALADAMDGNGDGADWIKEMVTK